jgi:acyl dehydratase
MYFEDFVQGQVFRHAPLVTFTAEAHDAFNKLTLNEQPIHCDRDYVRQQFGYDDVVINGAFIAATVLGIAARETTMHNATPTPGIDHIRLLKPVFPGDTLQFETEVMTLLDRGHESDRGQLRFIHTAKRAGTAFFTMERVSHILKRPKDDA